MSEEGTPVLDTHRFYRTDAATYEAARAAVDAAFGFANGRADTSAVPAASAPTDDEGRVYIAILHEHAALPPIADALAAFEEVTRADYEAAQPDGGEL